MICWCNDPTVPTDLFQILEDMTLQELEAAALQLGGTAGRLAWVEIAKRKRYFDFTISMVKGKGKLSIRCTAKGVKAHESPKYEQS